MASNYTAKDITVLEGLEPVRKRPGMYIGGVGSSGLHHLVWEILDNSIDEAMNGHASNILVALHKDSSSITVQDDGRGFASATAREASVTGMGLAGMRERLGALGGALELRSQNGGGVTVVARLPLAGAAHP